MKRPYVVCHMLTSIDGKIDGEFFESSESLSALRRFEKARDFYECNAVLYGTTTMERGYSNGRINSISKNGVVYPRKDYVSKSEVENYIVSVDPEGILAFDGKYIERKNREKYHIIEILIRQSIERVFILSSSFGYLLCFCRESFVLIVG